jgi:hypothetical protein
MLMPSFFGRCLDRWAHGPYGTAVAAVMMPWNEGQVTTTIAETGAPWPVNASNPDFLHNPAVVQQSTETVHTVCEGDRPHWSSWDVTAMAREWAAGSLGNNGVILWATNEEVNGRDLRFAARETTNATIRPVLQGVRCGDRPRCRLLHV